MGKYEAILSILTPMVINEIVVRDSVSEFEATKSFYKSQTYELLENEQTGVWHYSPINLYHIYRSEIETGVPVLPEEV